MKTKILFPILLLLLSGCGLYFKQPMQTSQARVAENTPGYEVLKSLPKPKEPIVVAVYKFTDQTGQYKPSINGANWSTAVTQGATSILLNALEESNWFIPIERENMGNLLNERKIIRSSRAQYNQAEGNSPDLLLPPLLYAGIILEGGIISYDANIITGGAGLRYFGAGSSGEYRQDRVTVFIRAISTKSGKILSTVTTSKTILSQAVDVGLFRFVSFKRLLEVETGYSYNEPAEMAVTEAIEKAVQVLIVEGMMNGMWTSEDEAEKEAAIRDYLAELSAGTEVDAFGRKHEISRRGQSIELSGTGILYEGDYLNSTPKIGFDLGYQFPINQAMGISLHAGHAPLGIDSYFGSRMWYGEVNANARFLPFERFTPYVSGGAGLAIQSITIPETISGLQYGKAQIGGGIEYLFSDNAGIQLGVDYNLFFSDDIDLFSNGNYNDAFWRAKIGIKAYLNQPNAAVTKKAKSKQSN